jgi:hypothetical protein
MVEEGTHEEEKQVSEDGGQASAGNPQPSDDTVKEIKEEEKVAEDNATSPEEEVEAKEAGEILVEAAKEENPKEDEEVLEEAIGENQANVEEVTEEESIDGAVEPEPTDLEAVPAEADAKKDIQEDSGQNQES